MDKKILYIFKIIIVTVLCSAVGSGIRVIEGILNGEHGAPDFVTPLFQSFGIITKLLLVISFSLLQKNMPFKNGVKKGMLFTILFWSSDYISQILGMSGAQSQVISPDAFSFKTILLDTLGYLMGGVIMGALLSTPCRDRSKKCSIKTVIFSSFVSMLIFPCVLLILELFAGVVNPGFSCACAFGILKEDMLSFYIVFYLFQALSGFLFPVFYYITSFNSDRKNRWLIFACIYGLMLWTPVVLIVILFGVDIPVTIAFSFMMIISIFIDTYFYAKILEKKAVTNP